MRSWSRALVVGIAAVAMAMGVTGCDKSGEGRGGPAAPVPSAASGFVASQQYTGVAIKTMDMGDKRCKNTGTGVMTIDASGAVTLVATITGDIVVNTDGACDINGTETVNSAFRATIDPSKPAPTISFTSCNRDLKAAGEVTFSQGAKTGTLTCFQADGTELYQLGVGLD